jgi:predicted RNase H-like nuclease
VYVGVDGYPRGWVAVGLDGAGRFAHAWAAPTLRRLLDGMDTSGAVGVDIPLGLLPAGWRTADRATAALLGARRSSVFAVPPRPVWAAAGVAEANQLCRALCDGAGFSIQAWGLRAKVLEADAERDAGLDLREVHPELAFAAMSGGPMPAAKKTWNGQHQRIQALRTAGVRLPDALPAAGGVAADDLLDAAAVAWSARRLALGLARCVPDPPDQHDAAGRPIVIYG